MICFKFLRVLEGLEDTVLNGGGKGAVQPIKTPPPLAPEPETAPMMEVAPEEEYKKEAKTQGAKTLQIPLGTISTPVINK